MLLLPARKIATAAAQHLPQNREQIEQLRRHRRARGPRGERLRDASFLLWLNDSAADATCVLPANEWVEAAEVVLSTDLSTAGAVGWGTTVAAGEPVVVPACSLVLLRANR